MSEEYKLSIEALESKLARSTEKLERATTELEEARQLTAEVETLRERSVDLETENARLKKEIDGVKSQQKESDDNFRAEMQRIEKESMSIVADIRKTQGLERSKAAAKEQKIKEELERVRAETETRIIEIDRKHQLASDELVRTLETHKKEHDRYEAEITLLRQDNANRSKALQDAVAAHEEKLAKIREESSREIKEARVKVDEMSRDHFSERMTLVQQNKELETKWRCADVRNNDLKRRLDEAEQNRDDERARMDSEKIKSDLARAQGELSQVQTAKRARDREVDELHAEMGEIRKRVHDAERKTDMVRMQMRNEYERTIADLERKLATT